MKKILLFALVAILSCGETKKEQVNEKEESKSESKEKEDREKEESAERVRALLDTGIKSDIPVPEHHSNARFRDVWAERTGATTFKIRGQAQVFEASVSWVVEDGHNEIKKGFTSTTAGAPEWGSFEFDIDVAKTRPKSTLTLILFEASAKDGSRQYTLPIFLY